MNSIHTKLEFNIRTIINHYIIIIVMISVHVTHWVRVMRGRNSFKKVT